ncbi:MAG TPA: 4'-phosphopantetheinyl transferase superfamily protein [Thermoanaerobaculia bacterium]|nr:4'-phosphopantetheinyl transferase superfamily protein [Thermoanaerobaculia bacterium]
MTTTPEVVVADLAAAPVSASSLSCEERARAQRFVFDRDRRRFVAGRTILRNLLSARLGVSPARVDLVAGANGKPEVRGSGVRFNLSHCEDLAVYAFSSHEIGVDVEAIRPMPDVDAIASGFFSRREREAFSRLRPSDRVVGFFNCWTRKEAFFKALGSGLDARLDAVDVSFEPGQPARIVRVGDTPGEDCNWTLESFQPAPGFVAAVVAQKS